MINKILLITLLLLPLAIADTWDAGTTFTPTRSNVTYEATEQITCTSLAVDQYCLTITGGDFEGSYCTNASTNTTVLLGAPSIGTITLNLTDLLHGNQSYSISYQATDVDGDTMTCHAVTNGVTTALSYASGTCSGNLTIAQNTSNTFYVYANDSTTESNATAPSGIEIRFNQYLADETYTNSLSSQQFREQYNFSSNLSINYSNVSWSLNSTASTIYLNLTAATITQNDDVRHSGDYLDEDALYQYAGTAFNVDQAYSIYKRFVFNNTNSHALPAINISIELDNYINNSLAEYQDGLAWPDINATMNGTTLTFNLSSITAGATQTYRFSYDGQLVKWVGDHDSDYTLSGELKAWIYDGYYQIISNLSGKDITHTVSNTVLGEWLSKTSTWDGTLRNPNGTAKTSTETDNIDNLTIEFSDAELGNYSYVLRYFTVLTGATGGGGGGGGGTTYITATAVDNQTLERLLDERERSSGYVHYLPQNKHEVAIYWLPVEGFAKDVIIQAVDGNVDATLRFSDNIAPYMTGAICDLRTTSCYDRVMIPENEQKYFTMTADLSDPLFEEQFLENGGVVTGYVEVLSGGKRGPYVYNLTIRKSALFAQTMEVTANLQEKGFDVSQKLVVYMAYILIAIISVIAVYITIRYTGMA